MTTKIRRIVAGLLALGLVLVPNAGFAQATYFWWQVVDEVGRPYPSQTVSCSVYDLATPQAKQLFLQPSLATHAGVQTYDPLLSDTNSRFHFYSATTDDVRLVCFYARGGAATSVRLSRFAHTVVIDRQGRKVVRFPFSNNATPQRTGIWLPQGAVIRDIVIQNTGGAGVYTMGSGADNQALAEPHLNVGFAGEHAVSTNHSLVDRMHLGMWGASQITHSVVWKRPQVIYRAVGSGAARAYGVERSHWGAAMAFFQNAHMYGSGEAFSPGTFLFTGYLIHLAGGLEVTYQTANVGGLGGHVYILYDDYHVGVTTTPAYGQ